jgi:hypothetical protein
VRGSIWTGGAIVSVTKTIPTLVGLATTGARTGSKRTMIRRWPRSPEAGTRRSRRPTPAPDDRSGGAQDALPAALKAEFNRMENAFARLKALLRNVTQRPTGGSQETMVRILDLVPPAERANAE